MNLSPLVSVIITTYNRVNLLEKTLESVINQTYKNLEIIIVSDASTDSTDLFIQNISDVRVRYFKLKSNSGLPAVTRNYGLKYSKGDFIAFCDDDDLWINTKIEKQLLIIGQHDFCFTKRSFINEEGFSISYRYIYTPHRFNLRTILITNYITLSSVLLNKRIFDSFDGFNESSILKASEDYELWTRLLAGKISIVICPEELVKYRIHTNNISNNQIAGIHRTMLINKSLFDKENISLTNKLISFAINYFKLLYYSLRFI
uniref:glycosyltransferase family 2 protein n=1 Tax=Algoriphagus sp. TaxID=1872435 RepID=UPI00404844E1